MIDYSRRSYAKELLDRDDIPFADIRQNMKELEFINTHLGGHAITLAGLKKLLGNKNSVFICEVGCGGGDNMVAIHNYCRKNNISVRLEGIDINENCIACAKEKFIGRDAGFIVSDYKRVEYKSEKPDIIFSSLFCHHFTDEQLTEMVTWMRRNARLGFFINDLHRHMIAYHFIKCATRIFSKSYLVKNDAPLSVLRGFKKEEWTLILKSAGISNYLIRWKWAFRYLLVVPAGKAHKKQ